MRYKSSKYLSNKWFENLDDVQCDRAWAYMTHAGLHICMEYKGETSCCIISWDDVLTASASRLNNLKHQRKLDAKGNLK